MHFVMMSKQPECIEALPVCTDPHLIDSDNSGAHQSTMGINGKARSCYALAQSFVIADVFVPVAIYYAANDVHLARI
jgi:hypothetical protein